MSGTCTILDEQTAADLGIRTEKRALSLLLEDRLPWSVAELTRELGASTDEDNTVDAITALAGAGLIHRIGEFVFPSHAARRADEIYGGAL
ncbi:MAG TPA: hypothetical protein VL988_07440 [Solirubrobacteraceae bacterium]|nr:hypothetical protein [Solirubrobacteraceae bacterium]HUA74575.1 hypothetical protein [Solirubrobacteraceae bacterium]